jgi:DNA-binding NarL/FixJ family response regulator
MVSGMVRPGDVDRSMRRGRPIRVAVVDGHPAVLSGVRTWLEQQRSGPAVVVLLDLDPKAEVTEQLVEVVAEAAVGRPRLVHAAASALVLGGEVRSGGTASPALSPALSPQERRALVLYASGLPMKSVARRLGISFETAKCYVDRVREKYERAGREARTKIELRQRAVEDGLLPDV